MQRLCRKCGVIKPDATGDVSESCPSCGAIYFKVESLHAKSQRRGSSGDAIGLDAREEIRSKRPLLLPCLLLAIVVGLVIQYLNEDRTPLGTEEGMRATAVKFAVDMSPDELANGFAENEVRQSAQIEGKFVRVRGVVASVAKGFLGGMIIEFAPSARGSTLRANLGDAQRSKVASLSKGDGVSVICARFVYSLGSPAGSDCIIE